MKGVNTYEKKRKTRKLGLVAKQMIMIGFVVWLSIAIIIAIVTNTRRDDMVELAGESGRGFAVVADEIAKLANECKESASRINDVSNYVITIVNELAEEAERMVEFARHEISYSCNQLKETSENYKNDVHEIGVLMQNFTASCEELKNVMDGIKDSIGATNVAIEETTRGISNTAETMVNLSASTENIMAKANENVTTSGALDNEVNKFTF